MRVAKPYIVFAFEKLAMKKNATLVKARSKLEAARLAMMEMLATCKGEVPHALAINTIPVLIGAR